MKNWSVLSGSLVIGEKTVARGFDLGKTIKGIDPDARLVVLGEERTSNFISIHFTLSVQLTGSAMAAFMEKLTLSLTRCGPDYYFNFQLSTRYLK